MTDGMGNAEMVRIVAEQVAETVSAKFEREHPKEPAIHPTIKWLLGAIGALGTASLIGGGFWLVSSVSAIQVTIARMDERMVTGSVKDNRVDDLERRVSKLETFHSGGVK